MLRLIRILGGLIFILSGMVFFFEPHLLIAGEGKEPAPPVSFEVASVHFEQNVTDGDAEVVFEVNSGNDGLTRLTVVAPDGRTVIDFTAPDTSTLGIRSFCFESPEPMDVKSLKSAYPEGVYTFAGETTAGEKLYSQSALNHMLPATVSFVHPRAGAPDVNIRDLEITWTPVKNPNAYLIEIEQDELDVKLKSKLPGDVVTLTVPDNFLLPGTTYKLSIGTVTSEGNISVVETTFTTVGKE